MMCGWMSMIGTFTTGTASVGVARRAAAGPCGLPPSPGGEGGAGLLPLTLRRAGEESLPCGAKHNGLGVGASAAVACATRLDRHHVTNLHGVALPARPNELTGTSHLESPVGHRAVRVLDVHEEPDMGIGPFDLRHCAGQCDRLA